MSTGSGEFVGSVPEPEGSLGVGENPINGVLGARPRAGSVLLNIPCTLYRTYFQGYLTVFQYIVQISEN